MGGTPWQYRLMDTPSNHIATSPEARFPAGFAESPTKRIKFFVAAEGCSNGSRPLSRDKELG
jgi:hypothetical protein